MSLRRVQYACVTACLVVGLAGCLVGTTPSESPTPGSAQQPSSSAPRTAGTGAEEANTPGQSPVATVASAPGEGSASDTTARDAGGGKQGATGQTGAGQTGTGQTAPAQTSSGQTAAGQAAAPAAAGDGQEASAPSSSDQSPAMMAAYTLPSRQRLTQDQIDNGEATLQEMVLYGRNLAIRNWKVADGFGNGRSGAPPPHINRMPGPDSSSCMSCHGLGNGVVLGWGNNAGNVLVTLDDAANPTVSGSNERNTPAEHGLVLLELLGKEMSHELQGIRDGALAQAQATGLQVSAPLVSKGVDFGVIKALPDGSVDVSHVVGIDADLYVRPFHAKGHEATLRIFTRNALNRHHGIQSTELLLFKDPTKDPATWDEDQDGVVDEMTEGELTALTAFQVALPIPQEVDQDKPAIARGRELMSSMGCTSCHRPEMTLADSVWTYTSSAGATTSIDLTDEPLLGSGRPLKEADGSVKVHLWGDLKRHDLGPESWEPLDQPVDLSVPDYEPGSFGAKLNETLPPIPRKLMMTTELWGGRDTGPWWHDGSSPTIEDAILRHGGEAQASRDAYAALSTGDRAAVLAFLNSLQVATVGEVLSVGDPLANADTPVHFTGVAPAAP